MKIPYKGKYGLCTSIELSDDYIEHALIQTKTDASLRKIRESAVVIGAEAKDELKNLYNYYKEKLDLWRDQTDESITRYVNNNRSKELSNVLENLQNKKSKPRL